MSQIIKLDDVEGRRVIYKKQNILDSIYHTIYINRPFYFNENRFVRAKNNFDGMYFVLNAFTPIIEESDRILTLDWSGVITNPKTKEWMCNESGYLCIEDLADAMEEKVGRGISFPTYEKIVRAIEKEFGKPCFSAYEDVVKKIKTGNLDNPEELIRSGIIISRKKLPA